MNRAAVKDLQEVGVAVYPNPTSADIKVATSETFGAYTLVEKPSDQIELNNRTNQRDDTRRKEMSH